MDRAPLGIAVVDAFQDDWAFWQVSVSAFNGPVRAEATNAVTSHGFDKNAFESLSWNRPVLVSARARAGYDNSDLADVEKADMGQLLESAYSWTNHLQDLFWQENDRRKRMNQVAVQQRKEARQRGEAVPAKYNRLTRLQDIDWPAPPPADLWSSHELSTESPRSEALRLARGCVSLLNYWLEIERERTKKNRKYFSDTGGPNIRLWPVPAPRGNSA
jgi:hypothetical protein